MESWAMMARVNSIWGINSSNRVEGWPASPACFTILSGHSLRMPSPSWFGALKGSRLATPSCYSNMQQRSSNTSIDDLRRQLEALHLEAEQARGKANAARARFMRLTEIVENLRMRAITDLRSGKEESARELIAEKQKVMHALEKSKQRAELLEVLSNKLGEAISSKELQVIASLSSTNAGLDESSTASNVRIVSPKAEIFVPYRGANIEETTGDLGREDVIDRMDLVNDLNNQALGPQVESDDDATEIFDGPSTNAVNGMLSNRGQMFPEFLIGVDNHLQAAEMELYGFLKIVAMILSEDVEKIMEEKVTMVRQTYKDVLVARARISKVVQQEDLG